MATFIYTKIWFFRKIIFLQNFFFSGKFFRTNIFTINEKIFFAKENFSDQRLKIYEMFFIILKNIIVQHKIFVKIKKFWKILKKTILPQKILKKWFCKKFKKLFCQKNIEKS